MLELTIFLTAVIYVVFMGVPFIKLGVKFLDYGKHTISVLLWYLVGILLLFLISVDTGILFWQSIYVFLFIVFVGPVVLFAIWWQKSGRPHMPKTKLSKDVTTVFEFTPRYAMVKVVEIIFQNICAANIIFALYTLTGSALMSGLYFALIFIGIHLPSVYFLGKTWFLFIGAAFFLVMIIIPIVILLSFGLILLFTVHITCYILFLVIVRYRSLSQK